MPHKKYLQYSMNSETISPYLGVRYQIEYHSCNLDCSYCMAQWKDKDNLFDNTTYRDIIKEYKDLPYCICLRIGIGDEPFTSQKIIDGIIDNSAIGKAENDESY